MMPQHIAQMLEDGIQPNSICESHKLITIMFSYTMDFKELISKLEPIEIIECINEIVNTFDQCTDKFDVFKVETKADLSYMVVGGLQNRVSLTRRKSNYSTGSNCSSINTNCSNGPINLKNPLDLNQAEVMAGLTLELLQKAQNFINPMTNKPFNIKFGFHSGPAVGGIVGNTNFQYCLFGDTVNVASRITTSGEAGRIHVSPTSYELLKHSPYYELVYRGKTELKSKGIFQTYWLVGTKANYSNDLKPILQFITSPEQHLSSDITHFLQNHSVGASIDRSDTLESLEIETVQSPDEPIDSIVDIQLNDESSSTSSSRGESINSTSPDGKDMSFDNRTSAQLDEQLIFPRHITHPHVVNKTSVSCISGKCPFSSCFPFN
ncbi:unnamed protein product [Didymodactylos carnosus]|uniref:Guanylate cyclase domain-containing protein n=1 Tax=Didymodactylos carnosus TaxID=1234261 RepID=A0A8S2LVU1_9BILA|nr:unnamed protein product [Didymodactylos carnosus]CAF3910823.1 unnamed protein product [Didymodactylos carnosus]